MMTCIHAGHTPATDHADMQERAFRARTIARALRHDLDNHPPKDERVREEAEKRCQRYAAEAAALEVELIHRRGW